MNIAHASSYNFTDKRAKKESAREFIAQFFDAGHVDLIISMAYEMNMSVEDATAYALAMFNAIQDLFYSHHDLDLGEVSISTIRTSAPDVTSVKVRDKVMKIRGLLKEPYFTNRSLMAYRVIPYLKKQSENKKRLVEGIQLANPEQYHKKKAKKADRKRVEQNEKQKAKQKRLRKIKAKRWEWTKMA